jgi:hypothetical protein
MVEVKPEQLLQDSASPEVRPIHRGIEIEVFVQKILQLRV